ncbi:MAG TPA: helix-turn-helix domain-containing protein [Solirubrobacter sp.]
MTPASATEYYCVARTLAALEHLADAPSTVTETADALAIHSRTARRILNRLVQDGYADLTPGARPLYTLTPRFSSLAVRALTQHATRLSGVDVDAERDREQRHGRAGFAIVVIEVAPMLRSCGRGAYD